MMSSSRVFEDSNSSDLHWRMNKKIAQLTKVIYQLNCRVEDADSVRESVASAYESEVAEIMSDARNRLSLLQEEIQSKKHDMAHKTYIKKLVEEHEKEKSEAMRQFEEYKQTVQSNEAAARRETEQRIGHLTAEVTAIKGEFQLKLKQMQDREAAVKKHEKNETDVLLQKKQHELDTVVKQSNEKYKAMLAQQMDEKDQLQQCLETEWTEKLQKAIKAADKKAAEDKEAALQKALGQYEEQRNAAIDKVKTEHRDELAGRDKNISDLQQELMTLKGQLAVDAKNAAKNEQTLKEKIASLNKEIECLAASGKDAAAVRAEQRNEVDRLRSVNEGQKKELQDLRELLEVCVPACTLARAGSLGTA